MNWQAIEAVFGAIYGPGSWLVVATFMVGVVWQRAARGTRLRYVTAAIYRPLQVVLLFVLPCGLILKIIREEYIGAGGQAVIIAIWVWNWVSFKRDSKDDDDFWSGLGGRVKSLLRGARARAAVLAPS